MKFVLYLGVALALLHAGNALECYSCVGDCSNTVRCNSESCMKTVASAGSSEGVVRGCAPLKSDEGCRLQTVAGASAEVCFCNTNKCNDAAGIAMSLPLLGLTHLMNRFF